MTNPHPRGSQQESEESMTDEIASLRASVERLTAERDEQRSIAYSLAMGCPDCGGVGTVPVHNDGDEFDAEKECPKGVSRSIADTGDYEWQCGCVESICPANCSAGQAAKYLRDQIARAESAEATIERLTRERDEAIGALRLSETRVTMLLGVERTHVAFSKTLHDLVGLDTSGDFDPDALPDRLRELVAIEQAWEAEHGPDGGKSAEATIARLAMVVRAAEQAYEDEFGGYDALASDSMETMREALSSLTAEDRRRAGIEG